jgi:putative DNA primase/helicase
MHGGDAEDFMSHADTALLLNMENGIAFTDAEISAYCAARVPHLTQRRAAEWRSACPIHHGKNDSFAVDAATGRWFCHSTCGRGGDICDLEMALTGADFKTAKAAIFGIVGRADLLSGNPAPRALIAATYDYTDEAGHVLYQSVRMEPKGFKQRKPDGKGGWVWSIKGVRLVLYRLPELLKRRTETVFICEGEKDVHSLESLGLLATCNPMGAGKWRAEYSKSISGRSAVILPDNDPPADEDGKPHYKGQKHAATIASDLLRVGCKVRIVEVPTGNDVSDWLCTGGTVEELRALVTGQPELTGEALAAWRARWELASDEPHKLASSAPTSSGSLTTRCLSDIAAKPVCWLWPGRVARGKLTIIAGEPGLGKSQIAASIAEVVTTGGHWPVDRQVCKPGHVLFFSAEDDPADTLRPRLEAAGANLSRVHIVDGVFVGYAGDGRRTDRTFSLQADVQALGLKLAELGSVMAVVIDPITAYLGDTDSHKNADVRALLAPLSELAARHDTAIIAVSHLTKAVGAKALMRVTGSLAFVAAARAAYLVTADPNDRTRRLFLPMKNNLGPDATGLAFRIEGATLSSPAGPLETSRVLWDSEPVPMTADEAMQADSASKSASALEGAREWLRETLANGPVAATDVLDRAKAEGISEKTLRRASKDLKVQKVKEAMEGGWEWSLPPKMAKSAEDARASSVATFEETGHLREHVSGKGEVGQ